MKKSYTLFIVLLLFLSFSSIAQVLCIQCYNQNARVLSDTNNFILNGGFENSTCDIYNGDTSFCPNSIDYHCDIAKWTCIGGGPYTYADIVDSTFSIIVEGYRAAYFGNRYSNACSVTLSDTFCINNIGCEVTGILVGYPYNTAYYGGTTGVSLQQTVHGLIVGNIYLLEFWAGGEWDIFYNKGLFAVDVGFGNIFLRDPVTPPDSGIGTRYVIQFAADSSAHTIKFTNWGHIGTDCTELVLDDVRLLVPGPDDILCATDVDEHSKNGGVIVFPNPFENKLTVASKVDGEFEITLFDITSRELLRRSFVNSATINTEQLARGVYLYELKDKNGARIMGKVVKE